MMRTTSRLAVAAFSAACVAQTISIAAAEPAPSHVVTQATIDEWKGKLSNWGRWGPEDVKGTLNLITDAKRKQAAASVETGITVSLARDLIAEPWSAEPSDDARRKPVQQRMLSGPPKRMSGATDRLDIAPHGYDITHLDALGHHLFGGKMYNGYPASENLSMERGLLRGGIGAMAGGIITRGVIVDIPALKGLPYLEPGTPVYAEDIEAWERRTGVTIEPGDAVFIRTGRWTREREKGRWNIAQSAAGLDASVIPWLKKRDVALLGSESALSVVPLPPETAITNPDDYLPAHNFALVALGMPLIDNADLDAVAATAKRLNRYHFLLTLAPVRVPTATGVPINPLATF